METFKVRVRVFIDPNKYSRRQHLSTLFQQRYRRQTTLTVAAKPSVAVTDMQGQAVYLVLPYFIVYINKITTNSSLLAPWQGFGEALFSFGSRHCFFPTLICVHKQIRIICLRDIQYMCNQHYVVHQWLYITQYVRHYTWLFTCHILI